MTRKFRGWSMLGVLVVSWPLVASAQTSEPGLTTVDPRAAGVQPPEVPVQKTAAAESTHVFEAFRLHADSMASQRLAGGVGSLLLSGVFIGTGAISRAEWHEGFGTALIVVGAVVAVGGTLTLLIPSEVEKAADANGVYTNRQPVPEQERALEGEWRRLASQAKTARHIGAGITFVLAAAAIGGAIYTMASNDIHEDTKSWLAPSLLLSGGATAVAGVGVLVMESPTESAYAAFLAAHGKGKPIEGSRGLNLRFSAAPVQRGGWGGFAMDF
jgi:hypothetical protein